MDVTNHQTHPKMLTVRETALTGILPEYALRKLVKQGKCPGFYTGTKCLVNYNALCEWLNNQTAGTTKEDNHVQ